jgi:hypothetical protein
MILLFSLLVSRTRMNRIKGNRLINIYIHNRHRVFICMCMNGCVCVCVCVCVRERFQVFMTLSMKIIVFWDETQFNVVTFFFVNVGTFQPDYTASYSRRRLCSCKLYV